MKHREKTRQELEDDARVDEAAVESFPASDAPSYNRGVEEHPVRPQGFMRPDELRWSTPQGDKPMKQEQQKSEFPFAYLIGGFALGAVCGLLLAPKKGSELVSDIEDWGQDAAKRGQKLYSKAKEYIPHRVKRTVAESVGAARQAGERAYDSMVEKIEDAES